MTLPGGLTVPLAVLRLMFDLEGRGLALAVDPDGEVFAAPEACVTDADRERLRQWSPLIRVLAEVRLLVQ